MTFSLPSGPEPIREDRVGLLKMTLSVKDHRVFLYKPGCGFLLGVNTTRWGGVTPKDWVPVRMGHLGLILGISE